MDASEVLGAKLLTLGSDHALIRMALLNDEAFRIDGFIERVQDEIPDRRVKGHGVFSHWLDGAGSEYLMSLP